MNTLQLQFLMLIFAGWVNRSQQEVIEYYQEENRILREQLGGKRLPFTDRQRRRLAARAKAIGRNTIKRILLENGLDPAPLRGRAMSWESFLKAHWGAIAATDFFSVAGQRSWPSACEASLHREVLTRVGLVRYFVLFVIDLKTRRVEIAGIVRQPDGEWMNQAARNLTDCDAGFLKGTRRLIHDRDPLFTEGFGRILKQSGVTTVELPARSPNLNAYAEHYHFERYHQGIDTELIEKPIDGPCGDGVVDRRERLGGILNYYHRRAA